MIPALQQLVRASQEARRPGERVLSILLVYIAEAHAADEWPVGDAYSVRREVVQPKTLAARVSDAAHFMDHFGLDWPLLVDDPEAGDPFLNQYGAWPTRFFVLKDAKISFIAEPCVDHTFVFEDVEQAVKAAVFE